MSKIALINVMPFETRLALTSDGRLDEFFIERINHRSLVGDIYWGVVLRVLPAMRGVFIDIGRERSAFLSFDDCVITTTTPKAGERLMVQVIKDEYESKGVKVTTRIRLSSRYLVYLPTSPQSFNISSRLTQKTKRKQLKHHLTEITKKMGLTGAVIARSACEWAFHENAEVAFFEQMSLDMAYVQKLWQIIESRRVQASLNKTKFALLYQELPLSLRALRDIIDEDTSIWVDERSTYEQLLAMRAQFMPFTTSHIHHHADKVALFDKMGIERQLKNALNPHFPLPSGGHLIIEQTKAMTTIDVNTGSFVGRSGRVDMAYQTNMEAVIAIAHQLRLRHISGMIVLDFINMKDTHQQQALKQALIQTLSTDPAIGNISPISELGLIEMTRKRTRPSLSEELCSPCAICGGTGQVERVESVAFRVIRELLARLACIHGVKPPSITIKLNAILADYFDQHQELLNLQNLTNSTINIEINTNYHQEQYAIIVDSG